MPRPYCVQAAYLCDAERAPLLFPQQLQGASAAVEVFFGYRLEHLLWELHVAILVLLVRIPGVRVSSCTVRGCDKQTYRAE